MIKALLRSEWIKFRSYYLALGAALAALVARLCMLSIWRSLSSSSLLPSILLRSLSSQGCELIF